MKIVDMVKSIWNILAGKKILAKGLVLLGVIGGIWSLYDRFDKPTLTLFAPYTITCRDAKLNQPCLLILAMISNSSKQNTFLYLMTMDIEGYSGGKWHKLQYLDTDSTTPLETDLSDSDKVKFGVNDIKYLYKFGDCIVRYDKPLIGYIPVSHENESVLKNIDKLRINIKDCQFRLHTLEVDFKEQRRKHDPTYLPEKPQNPPN